MLEIADAIRHGPANHDIHGPRLLLELPGVAAQIVAFLVTPSYVRFCQECSLN